MAISVKFEKRLNPSFAMNIAVPLLSVVAALALGALFLLLTGRDPVEVYEAMFKGALGSSYGLAETVVKGIPLMLCALGISVAFRMQLWNIGAEGQFYMGAFAASWLPLTFPDLPAFVMLPGMFVLGCAAGGLWGLGPAMLRAASKNFDAVTVVVDPEDYPEVVAALDSAGGTVPAAMRLRLAVKAFAHTARYDGAIANYLGSLQDAGGDGAFPLTLSLQFRRAQSLRYGENPHQRAAFYVEHAPEVGSVASARQLQGKELSFNNIADTDAALECVKQFSGGPACVIVKHANPCGVAVGSTLLDAYDRAYRTDPTSAFGGILAFNQALDGATAAAIVERQFVEVVVAPVVSGEALAVLAGKKNVRVLATGDWPRTPVAALDFRRVDGGLLVQDRDRALLGPDELRVVTRRPPGEEELADLLFAWKVAKYVKSNAIVYARNGMTVGIGAGQMSRVYSARIAAIKAADEGLEVRGSVMASDAFFPFRDGIDAAAAAGVTAVIQPGGSLRDPEVIAAADEHGMAMVFTGLRHFRH